ncbi:D-alanyl-D-alanine carboxypeptidase family protein [Isoptericola halotolerans]|uniref:D-alanyl-D-alanine carboxypeptidase family protein n=1 Tax=Isoptericola halotolerans TaxID=300560 RepID=UPI003890FD3E
MLPSGATAFDEDLPGVARLDADLLSALRQATADAADDEYTLWISIGRRSTAYQNHLREQAVDEHGSAEEAARWVATAETSTHVIGEAVDITPDDAIDWLSRHGDAYGLCQTYGNESWHFELRPDAPEDGCPTPYPDAAHDPRWQR